MSGVAFCNIRNAFGHFLTHSFAPFCGMHLGEIGGLSHHQK